MFYLILKIFNVKDIENRKKFNKIFLRKKFVGKDGSKFIKECHFIIISHNLPKIACIYFPIFEGSLSRRNVRFYLITK